MNVDVVFEGGGVLGISFVGGIKALEEKGYEIKRCAGASVGSLMAALVVAGYEADEIQEIIKNVDYGQFLSKTGVGQVPVIGTWLSLLWHKGFYDSYAVEAWVHALLKKKGLSKFKDVMEKGGSRLKVVAADITNRRMMILPDDLERYGIDSEDFSIAKAVRMSCGIPFFYTPVVIEGDGKRSFIVDGGLMSNFPIWIFDVEGAPRWPTFGMKIEDTKSNTSQGKTGMIAYVKDMVTAPLHTDAKSFIRDKDAIRTIIIDNDATIKATDFKKVKHAEGRLYEKGYGNTIGFLDNWDFSRYVQTYRK